MCPTLTLASLSEEATLLLLLPVYPLPSSRNLRKSRQPHTPFPGPTPPHPQAQGYPAQAPSHRKHLSKVRLCKHHLSKAHQLQPPYIHQLTSKAAPSNRSQSPNLFNLFTPSLPSLNKSIQSKNTNNLQASTAAKSRQ